MPNFSLDEFTEYNNLSEEEQKIVLQILQEMSTEGTSPCYDSIALSDYKETPVDIITFIKDRKYLGDAWHTPDGKCKLFPFWEEKFKQLFPDNLTTAVNNTILSGARGLGKSECAVTIGLYLMYRLMCLKDPYVTLGLKPTERVAFAFMNITEELALDIGVNKFQNTVQLSPWFMKRGTLSGKKDIIWNPPEFINIIVGSQPRHVIGQGIYFCLDGDTVIKTTDGDKKIKDLENKTISVYSLNEDKEIVKSSECTVKMTGEFTEQYEIELYDGTILKCTPNHMFMLKDGTYKEAQQLTENDDLAEIEPFGYIYKTTNKVNNKIYIGQKKSKVFLKNDYLGSGFLLNRAVKKYGKECFDVELLEWCFDKKSLDETEKYYIKEMMSSDNNIGYNVAEGGQGGNLGEKVNKKISKSLEGHKTSNITKEKLSEINRGKKLSPETKEKISAGNKGKTVSEETKLKMSISAKKVDRSNRKPPLSGKKAITNSVNVRYINCAADIPEGWTFGNCKTKGTHNMENYYSNPEMKKKRSYINSGSKNPMYGKGYKVSSGKNGRATKNYFYKNSIFETRKDLVKYLKDVENICISDNTIKLIVNKNYGIRIKMKYSKEVLDIYCEEKNEN